MSWRGPTNNDSIQTPPPHLSTSATRERDPLLGMNTHTRPSQELSYTSREPQAIMVSKDTIENLEQHIAVWLEQSDNHLSDRCPPSLGRADHDPNFAGKPEESCQLSVNPDQASQVFTEDQQGTLQYNQSLATQSQAFPASTQTTLPSAQQTASHFTMQSQVLPVSDEISTGSKVYEDFIAKLEEFQGERFNNCSAATPRFRVQEGKQSGVMVTKEYVSAGRKTPITFELHDCQIGLAVIITPRYTSPTDKLKPVHPCKKHQGEKEDIPKESSFYVTSHNSRFEIKDKHPYIILPIDKLNPDGTLIFSVASICWSSCHSKNEIELILQLVKDSNVILEDSFKMHFYENASRDHEKMLIRKGLLKESGKHVKKRTPNNSPTSCDLETGTETRGKRRRTDPTNSDHEAGENVGDRGQREECPTPGPSQVQDVSGEGSLNANAPVMCQMQYDESAIYGTLVAQKLRSLSDRDTFLKAQHEINDIIYKAETGQL